MPERTVTVYRFEQLWRESAGEGGGVPRAAFAVECAAGTYVRSLVADLGDAYCLALRRTAIGPFQARDASPPPARRERWHDPPLIGIQRALAMLPAAAADSPGHERARQA
jgi:tRNA pseudouridine55 synthase